MTDQPPDRPTRSGGPADAGGPIRPGAALALAAGGFVALAIFALGMTSLLLDRDVIAVPGLGQLPGIVGVATATVVFAAATWPVLRRTRPSYGAALPVGVAVFVGYVAAVWLGALIAGAELSEAGAAAAGLVTGGFAIAVAAAAAASALFAVALVRTVSARPRWPWEDEDRD